MSLLSIEGVRKSFGGNDVLDGISFTIDYGQKVALVGYNGTGKSTLLKIISGEIESDEGLINLAGGVCVGYLPQEASSATEESISDYLYRVTGIGNLVKEMNELSEKLNSQQKIDRYGEIQETYEHLGGYEFDQKIRAILFGFGLDETFLVRKMSELSSGQKSKVALTGILLRGVDLLLLDEPTNNQDLPALIWLESFIASSKAACIVVSHDRSFLDHVTERVLELDWESKKLTINNGSFSDYLERQEKLRQRQREEYRLQQEEIKRLNDRANRLRSISAQGSKWKGTDNDKFLRGFKQDRSAGSARLAKTIEKRVDQMEKIALPSERPTVGLTLDFEQNHGNLDIHLSDVIIGYDKGFRFGPVSFDVRFGSRIGFVGDNGSGKSTLLKTITGQLAPISGELTTSPGIVIGNMMQEHETLPRNREVLDFMNDKTGLGEPECYAALITLGLTTHDIKNTIGNLSPGSKTRMLMAMFSVLSINTLVLDEPTNHLDMEAMETLEDALKSYQGTILVVTHDRRFLEKANLDDLYELSGSTIKRITSLRHYVTRAEKRAKKMLQLL